MVEAAELAEAEPAAAATEADGNRSAGPSVTLEISEPAHPASGPADEVAEVPSRTEDPAATPDDPAEPAVEQTEPAKPADKD